MSNTENIELVRYQKKYGEAAVMMWRNSKEKAIGVKETHSFEDHLYFLNEILVQDNLVYLALLKHNKEVVGLMATNNEHLNQLYIHIDYQRIGIGSRFLNLAKESSSGKLQLYTFEVNHSAQTFYERHDFQIIGRGNNNGEGLPDILYEWHKNT